MAEVAVLEGDDVKESPLDSKLIKIVVVGDGAVGKTCLLMAYTKDTFSDEYLATVFDNYQVKVPIGEDIYTIAFFDTPGQEDYDRFRPLVFPKTDIFIVCFSIVDPTSFENIEERWIPEIHHHASKDSTILLIGTKVDLRDDPKTLQKLQKNLKKPVSTAAGEALAKKLNCSYGECSSFTRAGVKDVFINAIQTVLDNEYNFEEKSSRGCKCSVM